MTVILRDSFLMTDKNDPTVLFYLYKIPYVKSFETQRTEMVDIFS